MSHPRELIDRIAALVAADYPQQSYKYEIEKRIPGTRMHPDLIVRDPESDALLCVVEIGYTRPEKLTAYRDQLGVPDVRWYDKQGVLHPGWETKSLKATVSIREVHPNTMYAYNLSGVVSCPECIATIYKSLTEPDEELDDDETAKPMSSDEAYEVAYDEARAGVEAWLITDYVKAVMPLLCDQCGGEWMACAEGHDEAHMVIEELEMAIGGLGRDLRDFGHTYGARKLVTWAEACDLVRHYGGHDPYNYLADGVFVSRTEGADLYREVRKAASVVDSRFCIVIDGEGV